MTNQTVKKLARATAFMGIAGSALVVLSMTVGAVIGARMGANGASADEIFIKATQATAPILGIVRLIGLATIVTGIILVANFKKANQKTASAWLVLSGGIVSWLIPLGSIVLWVIAAVFLLGLKFNTPEDAGSNI